jgi:hypothetical protein
VGTDLVQANPLVLSAAVGHLLFGDFQLDLTTPLLIAYTSAPGFPRVRLIASSGPCS